MSPCVILAVDVGALMLEAESWKLKTEPHAGGLDGSHHEVEQQPLTPDETPASSFRAQLRCAHPASAYKVIANLPYYITAAAIRHLLEAQPPPAVLVLTVQREVAERMVARPPEMSLLALGVQFYCTGRIAGRIPAGAFYPVPKVESAVVRLDRRPEPAVPGVAAEQFFRVARAGFSQPRKQLRNSLAAGLKLAPVQVETWLSSVGIDPRRRAETLTIEEWGVLASANPRL